MADLVVTGSWPLRAVLGLAFRRLPEVDARTVDAILRARFHAASGREDLAGDIALELVGAH